MRNITVLFEKSGYKNLVYKTTEENQTINIVYSLKYFESIIIEETGEDLITKNTDRYTFHNIGNHIVKVKFKIGIKYLYDAFMECKQLIEIPENLFYDNPEIIEFGYCYISASYDTFLGCFMGCTGLTSIPKGLFNNNKAASDFYFCFALCPNLTGETPSDENGIKLWERTSENGYIDEITGTACFTNCLNLTDYSEIPDNWKTENP